MTKLLVVAVLAEVDTGPPTKQGQRALVGGIPPKLLELGLGLLGRPPEDRGDEGEDLEVGGVAAELVPGQLPHLGDALGADLGRVGRDEDGLGVLGGEELAGARGAGLEQERRPLRAGLHNVRAGDAEEPALVVDLPHQVGLGVDALFAVQLHGVVSPRRLE